MVDDGPVISRAHIARMATAAYARGDSRDSHGMKPWAPALTTWLHAYDAAATTHPTPASMQRVEEAQGAA